MQVTETGGEKLRRELTVVVPKDDFESRVAERLREVGQAASIPGFRPGKVPMSVLKTRFGKAARAETVETTVQETAQRAMDDREWRPAMPPAVDIVTNEDGADLEYKLTVEVFPDIPSVDFGAIELERMVVEVTDERVEENLGLLAESRRTYSFSAGRAAAEGDMLVIDYEGRIDGKPFEGGSAEGFELLLGRGQLFSEFDERLAGLVAGDAREVGVSFAGDRFAEDLRGKEAVFEVKIVEVREPDPVLVDDSFAESLGHENLAGLREAIRKDHERAHQRTSRQRLKLKLLDKLSEMIDIDVPPGLLEQQFDAAWRDVERAREAGELDADDREKSEEELRETYMNIARRRVTTGLLLNEIVSKEGLAVSGDEIAREMIQHVNVLGPGGGGAEMMELYRRSPEAAETVRNMLLEEKAVDYVLELAQVTDRVVAEKELYGEPDGSADRKGVGE